MKILTVEYWDQCWEANLARLQRSDEWPKTGGQWLEPYMELFRAAGVQQVLEVGCGFGTDTRFLSRAGFTVTATDLSPAGLAIAQSIAGEARFLLHDSQERFPLPDGSVDLVVASLSLHYFDFATTRAIVGDLARVLRPAGLLLYRLNAQSDPKAGAPSREQDRYFYNEAMCQALFADWESLALAERTVDYLGHPKSLWEGLVRKSAATLVGK